MPRQHLRFHDDAIPILDLRSADLAADLWTVACAHGCFHLVGARGVGALRARLLDSNRRLHAVPIAEQRRLAVRHGRGYAFAASIGQQGTGNGYASFTVMSDIPRRGRGAARAFDVYGGRNRWPAGERGLRARVLEDRARLLALAQRLLDALFATRTRATVSRIRKIFSAPTLSLRFLRYPSRGGRGAAFVRHRDYGGLTLIVHEDCSGLSIGSRTGPDRHVAPLADSLFVNFGDALARVTNDAIFSPPHEVSTTPLRRDAVVFFLDPSFDASIAPLAEFRRLRPSRFAPVRFGNYLLLQTFLRGFASR